MSLLIFLLIIIFVVFILPGLLPRIGAWLLQRQMRKMYNSAFGRAQRERQSGSGPRRQSSARGEDRSQQPKPKKVFTQDMGEYVAFEEITVSETTTSASYTSGASSQGGEAAAGSTVVEQQISDVEWTEIES